jgi:hypothetical protein
MQGRRPVLVIAIALIAAQVAWRAEFLSRMYFYRQDFFNLDFAIRSPFSWHYLTYVGTGHLMIGERAIIWVLARASLYSWGLASAVSLAFLREGATVAVTFRKQEEFDALKNVAEANGSRLEGHGIDVTDDHVLGSVDQGFRIAMWALQGGRVGIAAQALGIGEAAAIKAPSPMVTGAMSVE